MNYLNYVDGRWAPGASSKSISKINPYDGSLLGMVAQSEPMDLVLALPGLKKAQSQWEKITPQEKSQIFIRLAEKIKDQADEIAYQEALHQGLDFDFVKKNSVEFTIELLKKISQEIVDEEILKTQKKWPTGLIGLVTAWPLSLRLVMERLVPALAAGNGVILKVSSKSPITGQILGNLFSEFEPLHGLVQILQGQGEPIANFIAGHPSLRAFAFVGSSAVAEKLLPSTLPHWKKVSIQAGAKNSLCLLEEITSKEQLQKILEPCLTAQGQTCWNSHRIFLLESHQESFYQYLQEICNLLSLKKSPTDLGLLSPMISQNRLEQYQLKISRVVPEQGQILAGGKHREGLFIEPTFTKNLPNCSEMQQEDIQGPLFIVTAVKYQHEISKWLNTTSYGHTAVIWGDRDKALKLAQGLHVARILINEWHLPNKTVHALKQSAWGSQDLSWNGSFFSDAWTLDKD